MFKSGTKHQVGRFDSLVFPFWLVASAFGDELFALVFFRSSDAAFGFSIGKYWWWVYQLVVTILFVAIYFGLSRMALNGSELPETAGFEKQDE
jgi:hypothetical protein